MLRRRKKKNGIRKMEKRGRRWRWRERGQCGANRGVGGGMWSGDRLRVLAAIPIPYFLLYQLLFRFHVPFHCQPASSRFLVSRPLCWSLERRGRRGSDVLAK